MTVLPSPAKSVMAAAPLCPNKLGLEGTLQAQLRGPSPLLTGSQFSVEISVILSSLLKFLKILIIMTFVMFHVFFTWDDLPSPL